MSSQGSPRAPLATAAHDEKETGPSIREYLTRDLECPGDHGGGTGEEGRGRERERRGAEAKGKRERESEKVREKKSKKLIEFYRATVYTPTCTRARVCAPRSAGHVCIYSRLQILTAPLSM